jgi:hypothetical protein
VRNSLQLKLNKDSKKGASAWRLSITFGILLIALVFSVEKSFSQTNSARIFKISFSEEKTSDSAYLYSSRTNLTSRTAILNYLTNSPQRLTERDVLIMNVQNHGEGNHPVTHFRWTLASVCKTTGAQLCEFDCSFAVSNRLAGIRKMSVMHWKSPFDDPRNLDKTDFYFDEESTGSGKDGLNILLQRLASKKPQYLGMAGSRYTDAFNYGSFETPFGQLDGKVHDCLKANYITEVMLCDVALFHVDGKDFYEKKEPERR